MRPTKILLLAVMMLNSACTSGQEKTDFCQEATPIYLSKQDKLTDNTARQILAFDDKGHVLCDWLYSR